MFNIKRNLRLNVNKASIMFGWLCEHYNTTSFFTHLLLKSVDRGTPTF